VEITKKDENGVICLTITGRLDAVTATDADAMIKDITKEQDTRLLFDLEPLDYISSAGLRVLLAAAKDLKRNNGKMIICALNEEIKKIFEISGFSSIIPIADTVASGLDQLTT
jgi:anti-anti-sigma factor